MEFRFEYDPRKSESNLSKHGIDFHDAQALWLDEELVQVAARAGDEPWHVVIGRIGDKHWSAVITHRDDRIRLISVRRQAARYERSCSAIATATP